MSYKEDERMTWNDVRKIAVSSGWVFLRHGAKHDIYIHPVDNDKRPLQLERHWNKEVGAGLLHKLKKQVGF